MLRRCVLAPVICLMVIVIAGAAACPAHARTSDKSSKPVEIVKEHAAKQQAALDGHTSVTHGKTTEIKKAKKVKGTSKNTVIRKKTRTSAGTSTTTKKTSLAKASKKKAGSKHLSAVKHPKESSKQTRISGHKRHHTKSAVASKKRHKKLRVARHPVKPLNIGEMNDTAGRSPDVPADLWLAKDAPGTALSGEPAGEVDGLALKILESAYHYLGTPYRYGGTTPDGFDCSGFVRQVFGENGISLGRSSRDQAREGVPVSLSELKPGDLIFFNMRPRKHRRIDHVGLYIGNGQFIHASSTRSREIKIDDLETERYFNRVVGARRVLAHTGEQPVVLE